jgi:tRNA dimethylallyltransferase
MKQILIITGPTGVGKSDFAEYIAAHIPAEIINADVGQLYEPLTIGTAKPAWQKSPIPHHLFDVCRKPEHYTVVAYRAAVEKIIDDVWSRDKLPIIVGGSGFYIKSLFFPPSEKSLSVRDFDYTQCTHQDLWNKLNSIDPVRASAIAYTDRYRVERALSIWQSTGITPSDCAPVYMPIAPAQLMIVTRNRDELYERINKRTEIMLEGEYFLSAMRNWIQEVDDLLDTPWEQYILEKKIIGYDDIVRYLRTPERERSFESLTRVIQQKTRHYAKRQLCFFRMIVRSLVCEPLWSEGNSIMQVNASITDLNSFDLNRIAQ